MSDSILDKHSAAFKEEAYELLTELETSLLELEDRPDDEDLISRVFRAMHTIKGSGAMFGFDRISAFTHEVETVFDLVRNGKMQVSKELINLTLSARDRIRALLDEENNTDPAGETEAKRIIAGLKALVPTQDEKKSPEIVGMPEVETGSTEEFATYRVRFKPDADLFMTGTNPLGLLNELRELGPCRIVAYSGDVPLLGELDPEQSYLAWDIILTTDKGVNAIKDVFIFVEDGCELKIEVIDRGGMTDDDEYKKLGDILVERGDIQQADLERILDKKKMFGEIVVEAGLVQPEKVQAALVEQQHVREVRKEKQVQETASSIRVPAEKLDELVNLVGEMVTVQARLSQTAALQKDSDLMAIAEEVERLTCELRDNALNIRMLPIGSTFSKFLRLVRDLSNELGKEIEMTTSGAETELDKTVIEKLNDPLVHLIRNSLDHGIETPDERVAAGKPRQGTVHLSAVHSGDSVLISIVDDGKGLDVEAIKAKAIEKGMLAPNTEVPDREIFNMIFAPGFSTAKAVTSVSGRGVGMDVVKQSIDALRGTIDLNSVKGLGTTITIRIPLTLAIVESLLVKIGDDSFVLPLSIVEECVELTRTDVASGHGRNVANVRGSLVPYIPLRKKFRIAGESPDIEQIVIAGINGERVGLVVDHVIGEHQTVIKSLGRAYKNVEGVSGATILGDGTVALILDVAQLYAMVGRTERVAA